MSGPAPGGRQSFFSLFLHLISLIIETSDAPPANPQKKTVRTKASLTSLPAESIAERSAAIIDTRIPMIEIRVLTLIFTFQGLRNENRPIPGTGRAYER